MFWDRIGQFKELGSVLFVVIFSITSLVWNANFVVRTVSHSRKVGNIISSSFQAIGNLFGRVSERMESFEKVRGERDNYLKKVEKYELELLEKQKLEEENRKLKAELDFKVPDGYSVIKAKVLTVRLNTIYRTIIINKGKAQGIQNYMPVIARLPDNPDIKYAVVGKVIAVSEESSIIQPLVNSSFSMGVQLPGVDIWAMLSGNSGKAMEVILNYLDSRLIIKSKNNETITGLVGRPVYSSGGSGVFPSGIPVGVITREGPQEGTFRTAYVAPYTKFNDLEYVTVIKKLPNKWKEAWPKEREPELEDPILEEPLYPDKDSEASEEVHFRPRKLQSKSKTTKPKPEKQGKEDKVQAKNKKKSTYEDENEEDDFLIKDGNEE